MRQEESQMTNHHTLKERQAHGDRDSKVEEHREAEHDPAGLPEADQETEEKLDPESSPGSHPSEDLLRPVWSGKDYIFFKPLQ